ncbi:MAG: hypothetical protein ABW352_19840 [Polyangiales bacterium]
MLGTLACSAREGPASTNTSSSAFATLPEKVAFLERYVTFRRHYLELEYGVFYRDNGGGLLPGPSEWDITIIARVPASELAAWHEGMKPSETQPPELANLASALDTRGVDTWYQALGKYVGIDRAHVLVVYRASAH